MHGASFLSPCHVQLGVMSRRRRYHGTFPLLAVFRWLGGERGALKVGGELGRMKPERTISKLTAF